MFLGLWVVLEDPDTRVAVGGQDVLLAVRVLVDFDAPEVVAVLSDSCATGRGHAPAGDEGPEIRQVPGGADRQFAQGVDVVFASGRIIKARCIYNPNVSSEPTCERLQ